MTSRSDRRDLTRQAILRAATEALAEGGSKNAGLIGIGKRAGVTHSTVLYHFGSAHELQVAVLNDRDRRFLDEVVGEAWTEGPRAALLNLRANAQFSVDHPELAKVFAVLEAENCDAHQPLHEFFLDRRRVLRDLLVAMMRAAIEAGEIRDDFDLEGKANEIIAFQTGAQIMWALDPEQVDLVAMYDAYAERLGRELDPVPDPVPKRTGRKARPPRS